ncbi:hypothetical protein BDU57DRAFT_305096 [Ampelomyces quisqualis]|uniref:Uncharacterized protein n=1 Tax=Ampelomyces quisqualis TaxID=50730 RepID=A0A6A5QJE6_AMPQU|nr:hypothetical protein BDU57DRAFT_305096 [Ampelomyces quisqualis]
MKSHSGNTSILTLRLVPQREILSAFRVSMKKAFDHLDALCDCLSSLAELTTFSICLDGHCQDNKLDCRCHLPGLVLARIVRAMPPSLARMDIATVDGIWEDKQHADAAVHLCIAISERIPNLDSLWLRASCICTEWFHSLKTVGGTPELTSKLRRAFIRLKYREESESLGLPAKCGDCEDPRHIEPLTGKPLGARHNEAALTTHKLDTHLLDL